jgi:hypothetical protein
MYISFLGEKNTERVPEGKGRDLILISSYVGLDFWMFLIVT